MPLIQLPGLPLYDQPRYPAKLSPAFPAPIWSLSGGQGYVYDDVKQNRAPLVNSGGAFKEPEPYIGGTYIFGRSDGEALRPPAVILPPIPSGLTSATWVADFLRPVNLFTGVIFYAGDNATASRVRLYTTTTPTLVLEIRESTYSTPLVTTWAISNGVRTKAVVVWNGAGDVQCYIDGKLQTIVSQTGAGFTTLYAAPFAEAFCTNPGDYFNSTVLYSQAFYPVAIGDPSGLSLNPFKRYVPQPRTIFIPAAGGGATIDCALGSATASGFAATVSSNIAISASLGTASASGSTANVAENVTITAALGTAAASGYAATIASSLFSAAELAEILAYIQENLVIPTAEQNAAAVGSRLVDGIYTHDEVLRIVTAILAGKVSGAGTGSESFRNLGDTKNRVIITTDQSGNRLGATYDVA